MAKLSKYEHKLDKLRDKRCEECRGQGGWKEYADNMSYKLHTCKHCKGEGMTNGKT